MATVEERGPYQFRVKVRRNGVAQTAGVRRDQRAWTTDEGGDDRPPIAECQSGGMAAECRPTALGAFAASVRGTTNGQQTAVAPGQLSDHGPPGDQIRTAPEWPEAVSGIQNRRS